MTLGLHVGGREGMARWGRAHWGPFPPEGSLPAPTVTDMHGQVSLWSNHPVMSRESRY